MKRKILAVGLLVAMGGCEPVLKHVGGMHGAPAEPQAAASGARSVTMTLQPGVEDWISNPHMHAFYDVTRALFADGADKVDVQAYEEVTFAIMGSMARQWGWPPDAMKDHIKDVPRQVVDIVSDDPGVLDSFETFNIALIGPP